MKKYICIDDIFVVWNKILSGDLFWRLTPNLFRSKRVVHRWNNSEVYSQRHWYNINAVVNSWNHRISGDENVDFIQYVSRNHLNGRRGLSMLSPGCGRGYREIAWYKTGHFSKIRGIDISPSQIKIANDSKNKLRILQDCDVDTKIITTNVALEESGCKLEFEIDEIDAALKRGEKYDVIYFGHALHHFDNVESLLEQINSLLNEEGFLIIDEFVGPERFQWTDEQMQLANALLMTLPDRLRGQSANRKKSRCLRRGRLLMWLSDPSEAVDSAAIKSSIERKYNVIDQRLYGGTLTHLIFQDIAHNFTDEAAKNYAKALLTVEGLLIDAGLIPSDFVAMVAKKR